MNELNELAQQVEELGPKVDELAAKYTAALAREAALLSSSNELLAVAQASRAVFAAPFAAEHGPRKDGLLELCQRAAVELAELRRELRDEPTKIGDSPMLDDGDIGRELV